MEGSRTATILIEYHLSYIEYDFSYYGGRKAVFDQARQTHGARRERAPDPPRLPTTPTITC
jgi:hypothetical protein